MKKEGTKLMRTGLVTLVLLDLAFCFSSVAQTQAAPAQISVSPAYIADVSQGDTFSINITVDPAGTEICAAQYVLLFNNMLLNATSQTQGPFLSQDGAETIVPANIINNTVGKIEYGENRVVEHGVTASGTLASITFEVIGTSGRSDLKLSDVILLDQNLEKLEPEINHGVCIIGNVTGEPAVTDITIEEAHEMLEEEPEEIILLDVRTEEEHEAKYIDMPEVELKNIPVDELENRLEELDKSKKIIVYCGSGGRSRAASEILVQHGFENVYNMLGGISEWRVKFPVSTQFAPTPTIVITPSPTPTTAASPTVTVSPTPTPMPEGKWKIPGFEAVFAIIGLLGMSYFIIKRKRGG